MYPGLMAIGQEAISIVTLSQRRISYENRLQKRYISGGNMKYNHQCENPWKFVEWYIEEVEAACEVSSKALW